MEPTLTWIDLTASDRDKMRRVLDLFNEPGTRDEMGIDSVRQALSDALFPGVSYLHRRLRYVLFIPWMYLQLEARRVDPAAVEREARRREIALIDRLTQHEDRKGIIGVRSRSALERLPSSVYWNALIEWGIFLHPQGQSWYHANFAPPMGEREEMVRADDPGVVRIRQPNWHPRLPKPEGFPAEASFALRHKEATFLQGRLEESCAGTLLGWLASHGTDTPSDSFYTDPTVARARMEGPAAIREPIELATRFSRHAQGIHLLYDLLLAEKRRRLGLDDNGELIDTCRQRLDEWSTREASEPAYRPDVLWDFLARLHRRPAGARSFLDDWSRRLADVGHHAVADAPRLRTLIEERERNLKGRRARLVDRERLREWQCGGGGRMDFRWPPVRQLLIDLYRGLA